MSENTNSSNIDVSNSFGVSPPRNDNVLGFLEFSRNLDIAKAQQNAEKETEYGKLKETISEYVGHHRLSSDEFVQNVADVVLSRNQESINAAIAPLIEVIRQINVQMNAKFEQLSNRITQIDVQMNAKFEQLSNRITQIDVQMNAQFEQLSNRITRLEGITQESRSEVREFVNVARQSAVEHSIRTAQNKNILNRSILARPADTICFFSGEDPIELGLPPLGTAADIDALSAEEIDRYCAGYELARPVFANGQWSGCRAQKESLRSFLCILSTPDLEQRFRNNRT